MTGGEPMLGLSPMIHYPGLDGERQLFPFRTMAMLMSLITLITVSWGTKYVMLITQEYEVDLGSAFALGKQSLDIYKL